MYKDKEIISINDIQYEYNAFYKRLQALDETIKPAILCPKCKNNKFTISYNLFKCIANCECGHSMTVYDG